MTANADRAVGFLGAIATAAAVLVGLVDNPWIRWPSVAIVTVSVTYMIRFFIKTLRESKRTLAVFSFTVPVILAVALVAGFQIFTENPDKKTPWCSPLGLQDTNPNLSAMVRGKTVGSRLQIDKIVVTEENGAGPEGCVKLDVSIRNPTDKMAYVDLAQISVTEIWKMPQTCALGGTGGGVKISKNYKSLISVDEAGFTPVDDIAQSVPPHGVDRFSITARLTSAPDGATTQRLVKANLEIFSDGSTNPIRSEPFIFASNPKMTPRQIFALGNDAKPATAEKNKRYTKDAEKSSAKPTQLVSDIFSYNSGMGPKRNSCP
ncbi:hypothetical protein ACFY5F_00705 [Streptomyces sp. NPDC013161]|uniref:hypothetical protein n=1 Tax=Streptomyces sp. NPDC013161 TaxID=3364862 RepID=UPI0036B37BAA